MSEQTTDFETMMPKPIVVPVYSRKESLEVWPIQLTEIKAVMAVCAPVIVRLKTLSFTNETAVMTLITECVDDLPAMLSACLNKPIEYFTGGDGARPLQLDEYIHLAMAVLRLNLDFFTQRVFPSVLPAVASLVARQRKPGVSPVVVSPKTPTGRGPSRVSSAPATSTRTSDATAGDNSLDSSAP